MSLSDIIVFYENEIIPIQTEIGSLRLDNCNDFDHIIDNNGTIEDLVDKVLQLNII